VKYFIGTNISNDEKWIEVSRAEHDALITAHKNLSNAIFIEEKFDIILENFLEYENDLLTTAWKSLVIFGNEDDFVNIRDLVTRRIINLLSTGSMFGDQCNKHLRAMNFITTDEKRDFENYIEKIKQSYLGYRFCLLLRNHALHIDLPVTSIVSKFGSEEKSSDKFIFQHRIVPRISIDALKENKDPELKPIIVDLSNIHGEVVDLRLLIREFVLGLSKINFQIRKTTAAQLGKNEELIFKTLDRLGVDKPSRSDVLYVFQVNELNKLLNPYPINLSFLARRRKYIEKNNLPDTFLTFYATNQI